MKPLRKESALERRLRELQEQSAALQGDIKSLSKTLKKIGAADEGGRVAVASLPAVADQQRSRLNPNYAASVGTGTTTSVAITSQEPPPAADEADVNIFNITPAAPAPRTAPVADEFFSQTASDTATPATRYRRVATPSKPQKIAKMLSSGSFGGNVPLSRERKVQRFRAIVALVAVATFAYIIYRSVFR